MITCAASKKKLSIMIDFHGVMNRMPELIKPMMKTMRACGHEVIICSGPTIKKLIKELEEFGYRQDHHYDKVISVVDYLAYEKKVEFKYDENGNPWTLDEIWWQSKGWIAGEMKVDIVIDDSPQYKKNMPKNVAFWLWS